MNVVVIGASVIDIIAYPNQNLNLKDSNPGSVFQTHGGVGRNIAENLARLKLNPTLLTAIGNDEFGKALTKKGTEQGIKFVYNKITKTPTYLAILDQDRDLHVAVFDADGINNIDVAFLKKQQTIIDQADLLVIETNLADDVLAYLFSLKKDIYVDAISTKKALKLKPYLKQVKGLKMNEYEAAILSNNNLNPAEYFINQGVKEVYITMGSKGSLMAIKDSLNYQKPNSLKVINATGAGDAYLAGIIYAKANNLNPIKTATATSISALLSENTVSEKLSPNYINEIIKEYKL
ncbi:MAG: PfkB family carbohydrate kinase [Acholeplasmataceae bacterium]